MTKVQQLTEAVAKMQKNAASVTERMVGSHLLDIVGCDEGKAGIVLEDFAAGRTLKHLDRAVEQAATRDGKRAVCGPKESTRAICQALGLPEPGQEPAAPADPEKPAAETEIDFLSLLEV